VHLRFAAQVELTPGKLHRHDYHSGCETIGAEHGTILSMGLEQENSPRMTEKTESFIFFKLFTEQREIGDNPSDWSDLFPSFLILAFTRGMEMLGDR
jgi:hypothetical protein